jgi:hypothetical protein
MQVTFENEEAKALIGLIDLAVKAGGLGVAETAVHFAKKLEAAAKEAVAVQANTSAEVQAAVAATKGNGADAHPA